jgi:SAM-dependent methyltransferase
MPRRPASSYGRFAAYYDFIYYDLVNYDGDVDFLERVFRKEMRSLPRSVLDLGCGTGNHDLPMASRGFRVTGLDRSADQLAIARRKARASRLAIHFVRGDMRSFDLGTRFDAAVCMFGAFGYLTRVPDVLRCLRTLRRHLRPDGVFVFEFWHTPAVRPHQDWFHKAGPAYELIRMSQGRFDARRHLLSIRFWFFVFRARRILDRFDETHTVHTFTVEEMRRLLERGGFELLGAYAGTPMKKGFERPTPTTFRIMAVARPRGPNQS